MNFQEISCLFFRSLEGNTFYKCTSQNQTRGCLYEKKRSGCSLVNGVPRSAAMILIFVYTRSFVKGYLRYKTITSQNVPRKAHIKNFFISFKNYVPFLSYSSFCIFNHPMIYQISDVTMSIST